MNFTFGCQIFPHTHFYSARDGWCGLDMLGKHSTTELHQPLAVKQTFCMAEYLLFLLPLVNTGAPSFTSRSKHSGFKIQEQSQKLLLSTHKKKEGILLPSGRKIELPKIACFP